MEIIFRNKTEAPTEPGWYYARLNFTKTKISPKFFDGDHVMYGGVHQSPEFFEWFGPVPEVREG